MTDAQGSQLRVRSLGEGTDAQASTLDVRAIYNFPSEQGDVSKVNVRSFDEGAPVAQVPQLFVRAIYNGRPDNRTSRAWNFSLDGHEMYVLRLGEERSLIFDQLTGQWAQWANTGRPTFRAHLGQNWIGMGQVNYLSGASTQVVGADDTLGVLWTLDPEQGYDEAAPAPEEGELPERVYFDRIVTGGLPMRGRPSPRLNAVFATIANGSPEFETAAITLRTSGDSGNTWFDHGTVTIQPSEFAQEIHWRSLGLVKAPGRIFEFSDTGATVRIDGVDININLEGRS